VSRVAIDVGQSGTRVREIDPSGREISHALLPVTGTGKTRELERLIVDAVDALTPASAIEMVAVGATGCFGAPEPMPWLVETLLARHGVTGLVVADDGVTSLLGARGEPFGLVAAAGTGVVAVAVGPDGVARVDGAGPAIGDEGSGRWIGRQGLIAALSVLDGRDGGSRRLLDSATCRGRWRIAKPPLPPSRRSPSGSPMWRGVATT
jgi:N-acetylglucosamine kinase-like BadF-type ATPase